MDSTDASDGGNAAYSRMPGRRAMRFVESGLLSAEFYSNGFVHRYRT